MSATSSEANVGHNRKLAQKLRSSTPENVVDAYRELRILPKGWVLSLTPRGHGSISFP